METSATPEKKTTDSHSRWPQSRTPRLHYCTKQHLWMRAVAENPYEYRIDVGLAPRAWDAVGDMLKVELYSGEDGVSIRRAKNIFYEEGDFFLSIQWEGIEFKDKEFYLVTGTNVWRCPIRGTVRLNPDDADRKWKVDRPESTHVMLTIHVSREDYLVKLRQEETPPEEAEEPPVEEPDPPKKHKENPNKNPKTNDPLTTYRHRWVCKEDYETFMRDMDP
jgi:hypothetical protein